MKILVTGGAGFIGSHLVERFAGDGHEVLVVDNLYSGHRANVPSGVRFRELDIRNPEILDLVRDEAPDVLCHQAAQMDVRLSVASPVFDAEVNLIGTLRLLEAAVQAGVKRVVFASSGGAVYGERDVVPTPESEPVEPISPYGVSKLSAERYLHYYRAVHGVSYAALRYANVYGPRQDPHGEAGVIAIFAEKLLNGEAPRINGDGLQTRDYVFVGDVVEANVRVIESDYVGALNVGTGVETDVNTIAAELVRQSGRDLVPGHGPAKAGEQRRSAVDASLSRKVLGWAPETRIEDGLRETFAWFRDRHQERAAAS